MGILGWFKNRTAHFDPERVSDEMRRWAVDKAITLTNPQLKLLSNCEKQLAPAVETTINYLRGLVPALPAVRQLSAATWSSDPALRAFFVKPADVEDVLARSDNLRTLFAKHPELDAAYAVLGMAIAEQQVFGLAMRGETIQRDVAQRSVSFSDHKTRLCGEDEARLRKVVGIEIFEYLLGQAMAEIGAERAERQELQGNRSLIRSRLRLLKQYGPGLGSMFGEAPAGHEEQARLEAELQENEKQLEAIGSSEAALAGELDCLKAVLENPEKYLRIVPRHLRLSTMNLVINEASDEAGADIDFAVAEAGAVGTVQRAFIIARIARADLPPPKAINYRDALLYI
jgi:hypothetical protein